MISRIFQYEIQGSRYSKAKVGLERGIFVRSTSYFIVVYRKVTNDKGLGLNSNYSIFMWRGDDMNKAKNAIEKYITTPFKEIKTHTGQNNQAQSKRASAFVMPTTILLACCWRCWSALCWTLDAGCRRDWVLVECCAGVLR